MHKITNLWKFELNLSSKLRDNNERKNTLVKRSCVLPKWLISRPNRSWSRATPGPVMQIIIEWTLTPDHTSCECECEFDVNDEANLTWMQPQTNPRFSARAAYLLLCSYTFPRIPDSLVYCQALVCPFFKRAFVCSVLFFGSLIVY